MSDIKMSDWFDLPTTPAKFWLAPVELDNDDRRRGQMIALTEAINSHDKLTARITELEAMSAEVISMLSSGKYKHDCSKIVGVIIKALKDNS